MTSYRPGDWKAACARCGGTFLASELRKEWKNFYTCNRCWEPRHPQDFVKAVPDKPAAPFVQPEMWEPMDPDLFFCSVTGYMPQADFGEADCMVVNF